MAHRIVPAHARKEIVQLQGKKFSLISTRDEGDQEIYLGFKHGNSEMLFSEFALCLEVKLVAENDSKFSPVIRDSWKAIKRDDIYANCVVLVAENSHAPILSSMMSRNARTIFSKIAEAAIDETPSNIRKLGKTFSASTSAEDLGMSATCILVSELTARVLEGKIKNLREWRSNGLEIINSIANRNDYGAKSLNIIGFMNERKSSYLELGLTELIARNQDKLCLEDDLKHDINNLLGAKEMKISEIVTVGNSRAKNSSRAI